MTRRRYPIGGIVVRLRKTMPSSLGRLRSTSFRFPGARSGTTAVEFGLLAVPFLGTILAMFEIAYVNLTASALQFAVTQASRQVLTGQMQTMNITTPTAFINQLICPAFKRNFASIDCSKLILDMRTATSFTTTDMTNSFYAAQTQSFCAGQPGQIVVLRVVYPLPVIFPLSLYNRFVGLANNVPGRTGYFHILMGSALFQEEPYTTSYTPPAGC